jgi:phosphatidylglycerophosphate synthase
MSVSLQDFFQLDDPTLGFLKFYVAAAAVLLVADFAVRRLRPARPASAPRPDRTTGRARPVMIAWARRLGAAFVRLVAGLPITPNQVTVIGLLLVLYNCLVFAVTHDTFWFGAGLIGALLFDTLDGQVARAQNSSSHFGGYLDAMIDRYQEIFIFVSIGAVLDRWPLAFLVITGSLAVSYAKARVALEIPTSNKGWPDLFEKPIRLFVLCVGLIGAPIIPWFLPCALWMLAAITHFTALQRFTRAYFLLKDVPMPGTASET